MPNTDKLQPDFNEDSDSNHKQQSISRDINQLQTGIKIDFDQKINELSDLLQRFKALVLSPNQDAANEEENHTVEPITLTNPILDSDEITKDAANDAVLEEQIVKAPVLSSYPAESARFENGLYKLNSQLYRFRLELDQELEFREEPLHVHFSQPSELSEVLQKLGGVEKHPGS